MKRVLDKKAKPSRRDELWTATFTLMGLRYQQSFTRRLLQGVVEMEESSTYQWIITKGEMKGKRETLLLQGQERFGKPTAAIRQTIESIEDLDQLEQMSLRVLSATSWQELLEAPTSRKRKKS